VLAGVFCAQILFTKGDCFMNPIFLRQFESKLHQNLEFSVVQRTGPLTLVKADGTTEQIATAPAGAVHCIRARNTPTRIYRFIKHNEVTATLNDTDNINDQYTNDTVQVHIDALLHNLDTFKNVAPELLALLDSIEFDDPDVQKSLHEQFDNDDAGDLADALMDVFVKF
jgi:hypothetical protein